MNAIVNLISNVEVENAFQTIADVIKCGIVQTIAMNLIAVSNQYKLSKLPVKKNY